MRVVAAENFWGNITSQLGGHDVTVTSLITNPNADPHLFETDAADAATLAAAQVVIENGAGYDTWMSSLLGADGGSPHVVNAATVLHVTGSDPNPHLWYDIPRVPTVAAAIAAALEKAAPQDAATFKSNLATFDASLAPLLATLATIKAHFHNVPVAYTERVPGYALAAAGLDVKTPTGFARAIEDGVDPEPGRHAGHAAAPRRPRHQRAALQRADRHPRDHPDPRPGPPAPHSRGRRLRDDAGRRRPRTSSGSSPS